MLGSGTSNALLFSDYYIDNNKARYYYKNISSSSITITKISLVVLYAKA